MKTLLFFLTFLVSNFSNAQDVGAVGFIEENRNGNGSYTSLYHALKNTDDVIILTLKKDTIKAFLNQVERFTKLEQLHLYFSPDKLNHSLYKNLEKIKTLTNLSINHADIDHFPDKISFLPNLKNLTLEDCIISTLSDNFFRETNIEVLNLKSNRLTSLPDITSDTCKVKVLSLRQNRLTRLPESFSKLNKLIFLSLANNGFNKFPNQILSLKNLKTLNIAFNNIESIPLNIDNLSELETLYLTQTKVRQLPSTIKNMKKLTRIYMYDGMLNAKEKNDIIEVLPEQCKIIWTKENFYHSLELETRDLE